MYVCMYVCMYITFKRLTFKLLGTVSAVIFREFDHHNLSHSDVVRKLARLMHTDSTTGSHQSTQISCQSQHSSTQHVSTCMSVFTDCCTLAVLYIAL